jgi:hypothetical protein
MLITSRFIVLNIPKTGSTFVRTVLKRVEARRNRGLRRRLRRLLRLDPKPIRELWFRKGGGGPFARIRDQHGAYSQVPARYRHLPVVAVARNPLDRYVSQYEFGFWRDYPAGSLERVRADFPGFPDLSFAEFLDYYHRCANDYLSEEERGPRELGYQTRQLVRMIFRDPERALAEIHEDWIGSEAFVAGLPELEFLRQERLNETLHEFLLRHGYAPEEIRFVLDHERIQPPGGTSRMAGEDWRDRYDPDLTRKVLEREKLLFRIFEWFGIDHRAGLEPAGGAQP